MAFDGDRPFFLRIEKYGVVVDSDVSGDWRVAPFAEPLNGRRLCQLRPNEHFKVNRSLPCLNDKLALQHPND